MAGRFRRWGFVLVSAAAAIALSAGARGQEEPPTMPTFGTPAVHLVTGAHPDAFLVADFTADALQDIATVTGGALTLVPRSGPTVTRTIAVGAVTGAASKDLDADGDTDLVLVSDGDVVVLLNDGTGLFPETTPSFSLSAGLTCSRVAIGDLNGDAFPDIVATAQQPGEFGALGQAAVFLASPGGAFAGYESVVLHFAGTDAGPVAIGDVDGDGFQDVIVVDRVNPFDPQTGCVEFLGNPAGDGALATAVQSGTTHHPVEIVLGDVTGDGIADVLTAGFGDFTGQTDTSVHVTSTDLGFGLVSAGGFLVNLTGQSLSDVEADLALGDFNGDGELDVCIADPTAGSMHVLMLHPNLDEFGDFSYLTIAGHPVFPTALGAIRIRTALLDEDDLPDVVAAHESSRGVYVLLNTTGGGGGGGGGGEALPAATNLRMKSKRFPGDTYQDGQKFTFTCDQPDGTAGLRVRLQSTTTPGDEPSWRDLPVQPQFKRAKAPQWKLVAKHVPPGTRYFRTVTSAPGADDGVNTETTGADAYIGPLDVLGRGAALVTTAFAATFSDPVNGATTHVGDTILIRLSVENDGSAAANDVRVEGRIPRFTSFVTATPAGFEQVNKGTKLIWTVPSIAPGETADFYYAVTVGPDAASGAAHAGILIESYSAGGRGTSNFYTTGRITIEIASPLSIAVVQSGGQPQAGQLVEYDLTCTNRASTVLRSAVAWDRLPEGTGFVAGQFLDAAGNSIAPPVAGPAGRSNPYHDREQRKVFWYLGDTAADSVTRLRLFTRVSYDLLPGRELVNGAYEFRGCTSVGSGCDPLDLDTLDGKSNSPVDVRTPIVGPAPADVPRLRLGHATAGPAGATLYDERYGDVPVVSPGEEIAYLAVVTNSSGVTADRVQLIGVVPPGVDLVPGSVQVTVDTDPPYTPEFAQDSGRTLTVDVGPVGTRVKFVSFRGTVAADVKDRTIVVFRDFRLETESLTGRTYADPNPLNVLVALPYVPFVETRPEVPAGSGNVSEGDVVCFLTRYENRGGRPGIGVELVQAIPEGCSYLDAAFFDGDGQPAAALGVDATRKTLAVTLGTLAPGACGTVRYRYTLAKTPKSGVLATKSSLGGDVGTGAKSGTAVPPSTSTGTLTVESDTTPKLFLVRIAPHVVRTELEFAYTFIVGNVSDNVATDVVVTMDAPRGTSPNSFQPPEEIGGDGKVKGRRATWKIGEIAPHSAVLRGFRCIVDKNAGRTGNAIIEDTLTVSAGNATGWKLDAQASLILVSGLRFESYAWPSFGVNTSSFGVVLGLNRPAGLDDGIRALSENSASVMSCGADIAQFTTGDVLVPLGGGVVFAFGSPARITASSGTVTETFGGTRVVIAAAGDVIITGVPSVPAQDASALLTAPTLHVDAGAMNLIAGGGNTIVAKDGRTLLGPAGTVLGTVFEIRAANIVAGGGGNIVAGGGGNIVAGGGGNIVAGGGGNIVAGGGGNIVAGGGGNIVAGGGGNIVAGGGGNKRPVHVEPSGPVRLLEER